MKNIPFVPFPLSLTRRVAKRFYAFGGPLAKLSPDLSVRLNQAQLDFNPREYMSIAFFALVFWTFLMLCLLVPMSIFAKLPETFNLIILPVSFAIGFLSFFYVVLYPNLIIARKTKDLEKKLLFALRHLLIQVKSGVPLFDALVSVSNGNYGMVSRELKECTKKISTGIEQTVALEELALKNPSLDFRRIIWQITSSIKTGADLGNTMESIVQNLSDEQKVAIRRYGSQLNPLAMMYMMLAVIIPSLGITFMIVFSSFAGLAVSETMFYMILVTLAFFQFTFIGMVKSRRPAVEL
jgi:flagellar protein FlaJ